MSLCLYVCMCVCVSVGACVHACVCVCCWTISAFVELASHEQMSYGSSLTKLSLLDLNKPVSLPLDHRDYVYIMLKFAIIEWKNDISQADKTLVCLSAWWAKWLSWVTPVYNVIHHQISVINPVLTPRAASLPDPCYANRIEPRQKHHCHAGKISPSQITPYYQSDSHHLWGSTACVEGGERAEDLSHPSKMTSKLSPQT